MEVAAWHGLVAVQGGGWHCRSWGFLPVGVWKPPPDVGLEVLNFLSGTHNAIGTLPGAGRTDRRCGCGCMRGGWGGSGGIPPFGTPRTGGCGSWTTSLFATVDMLNLGASGRIAFPSSPMQSLKMGEEEEMLTARGHILCCRAPVLAMCSSL